MLTDDMAGCLQWAVASLFILCIGMAMAELGSAAPTSGGVSPLSS